MPDLVGFKDAVCKRAGKAERPFLCEGSPFNCDVFLVGINPSRDVPMWKHWRLETGCDRAAWTKAYEAKYPRKGPTRERLERLRTAIGVTRVLETNVFHHRSKREADLDSALKQTSVFEYLLETLKPRVVFVHGKTPVEQLESMTKVKTKLRDFVSADWRGIRFDVVAGHHLSYQWSYADVTKIGERIKARCDATSRPTKV